MGKYFREYYLARKSWFTIFSSSTLSPNAVMSNVTMILSQGFRGWCIKYFSSEADLQIKCFFRQIFTIFERQNLNVTSKEPNFKPLQSFTVWEVTKFWEQGWRSSESARLPGVICGLSLLLVLFSAPRGFSPGTPVFLSPQKPTFPNSNPSLGSVPISAIAIGTLDTQMKWMMMMMMMKMIIIIIIIIIINFYLS